MNDLYLCHACGGVCSIARVNTINRHVPQFCPLCGERHQLTRVRSSFDWHTARCFQGLPKHILQTLAEVWGANVFNEQEDYPLLRDYVAMRWQAIADARRAKNELPC